MGTELHFDLSELTEFKEKLETGLLEEAVVQAALELAGEWYARTVEKTPVISGTLRDSWVVGDVKTEGNSIVVELFNTAVSDGGEFYGLFVEFGHRQEPGRFVPAIGKRLVADWVDGKFMLTTSMDEVEKMAEKIVAKRLEEAWNSMG